MNRKQALDCIRVAGYHLDRKAFVRLYVENRISITVAREAFEYGFRAKSAGLKCHCRDCEDIGPPGYGETEHCT